MPVTIFRELSIPKDFNNGFIETLSALKPIELPTHKLTEIFQERLKQGWQTYILELKNEEKDETGTVVATASVNIETKPYNNGEDVGHFEDVSVKESHQGQGYGKKIINLMKTLEKVKNCYKFILDCNQKNVPFYEKCGFFPNETQMRLNLH